MKLIAQRVADGASLLDEVYGECWPEHIDVNKLDVNDVCDCPYGQLWGTYQAGCFIVDGFYSRCVDHGMLGFMAGGDKSIGLNLLEAQFRRLTAAWRKLILARLAAARG